MELQRAGGSGHEIDPRFRVTASLERVERPDHSARTDVEVLQRRRRAPHVPLVRGPEPIRIVGLVGVSDDRPDPRANALLVPRLVGGRLERLGLEEHYAAVTAASRGSRRETTWETPSPPIVTP